MKKSIKILLLILGMLIILGGILFFNSFKISDAYELKESNPNELEINSTSYNQMDDVHEGYPENNETYIEDEDSNGGGGSSSSKEYAPDPELLKVQEYLEVYELPLDTIIFYYSNDTEDIHSQNMLLIVNELEYEYFFYKTNNVWDKNAGIYLNMVGITPTFICAKTNERIVGEVSKEELEQFAIKCKL